MVSLLSRQFPSLSSSMFGASRWRSRQGRRLVVVGRQHRLRLPWRLVRRLLAPTWCRCGKTLPLRRPPRRWMFAEMMMARTLGLIF
jgi:hypothetical protein